MRAPLSWIREFTPVESTVEELVETFADLGFEVDGVETVGEGLEGIVAARVIETAPHPDADRIQLVQVDPGDGQGLQVCCGAFNMSEGDLVPLATVGTTMPDGMEIAARKMRGEVSNGMLCSAAELGLGEDHSGIHILAGDPAPGTPVAEVLGILPDTVFDLDVLPNRPDGLSMLGVARDLSAKLGLPLQLPNPVVSEHGADTGAMVSVEILDDDLCGRFVARVITGLNEAQTPPWMAARLLAAGMRPISVAVDVSNYVMLELGQPSHAYDLAKVDGATLRVRRAREGEQVETLDGVLRTLTERDGVIADGGDTAIGVAGVMGGASTEISESTTDVLFEAAWWDPMSIAVSSAGLNLHSEASLRFKRGVDPEIAPLAALRFAELLGGITGARLHPGVVDEQGNLPAPQSIALRTDRVNLLLGTDLDTAQVRSLIDSIGFSSSDNGNGSSSLVDVPSWRLDCTSEVDLVEEVGRMHGFSSIPKTVPTSPKAGSLTPAQRRRRRIRAALVGAGLSEAMPMPFLAPGDLQRCGLSADGLRVANPLAAEESVLRTSLLPGLLAAVSYNAARRTRGVRFFEVARVFGPGELLVERSASTAADRVLSGERESVAAVLAGAEAAEAVQLLEVLLSAAGVGPLALRSAEVPGLHPGRSAVVEVAGVNLGSVGEVDPGVAEAHDIDERLAWLELDMDSLLALPETVVQVRPVSRFPSTDVDLAFVVDERVPAAVVAATIHGAGEGLVTAVDLFDVFRSDALGVEQKSLAFRLRFCAMDRTLTDSEVGELRQAIIAAVQDTHSATLRG